MSEERPRNHLSTRWVWLHTEPDREGYAWREVAKVPIELSGMAPPCTFPRPDGRVITVYEIEEAKCHG